MKFRRKCIGKLVGMVSIMAMIGFVCGGKSYAEEFGCDISNNEVVLESGEAIFTLPLRSKYDLVKINKRTIMIFFRHTSEFNGPNKAMRPTREKRKIELLTNETDKKVVAVTCPLFYDDKTIVPSSTCKMKMTVEIQKGLPCAFVNLRIENLKEPFKANLQAVTGSSKSNSYTLPDMQKYNFIGEDVWKLGKNVIGKFDWVFVWPKKEGDKGLGIITNALLTQSKASFNWSVKKSVEENDCVEIKFILVSAKSPEEAKQIFEKIEAQKPTQFVGVIRLPLRRNLRYV